MKVVKRNGISEEVKFEKIQKRLKELSDGLNVEVDLIVQKAIERMFDGIKTKELDEHLATITVNHSVHPHSSILAGRICVSSLHKETRTDMLTDSEKFKAAKLLKANKVEDTHHFIKKIKESLFDDEKREHILANYLAGKKVKDEDIDYLVETPTFYHNIKTMNDEGILSNRLLEIVTKNRDAIEAKIDYSRDFMFDYFGFKTLEKSYLLRQFRKVSKIVDVLDETGQPTGEKRSTSETVSHILERPQDLFMRVSLGILEDDLEKAFEMYDLMSQGFYTHATPTLFNSGTNRPQMSSCFLLANESDSIEGIFHTFEEEARISKNSGGIGVWYHNVRSAGSHIKGTNGTSNGILPFLKIKNEIAKGIDQGGKRPGSIAVYLEPWHADIREFIQLRRNNGSENQRARDLFLALWVPNLFYKRIIEGGKWSLFDPASAPGLHDVVGDEFEQMYEKYEREGRAVAVLEARELMKDIFEVQVETGLPYIVNKDLANLKSNQKNLGVIKSSNLCAEILEFSNEEETAVCNLGSLCLTKFVKADGTFDFEHLHKVARTAVYNLNAVIDKNYYVNEKTRKSNMRHRPIALGVQGLADVFFKMRVGYGSEESQKINHDIFETIYHAALTESLELAKKEGHYPSMKENGGAPISHGIFQFDMWGVKPSDRYDWEKLRGQVIKHGIRNSLLTGLMPTASSSQIFGNTESFEPLTENLYKRKTNAGEFTIVNKHMIYHLEELGLWNKEVMDNLVKANGSIQGIDSIPQDIKDIYKTVWEIGLRKQIDMSAQRGAYICQTQSFNVHMDSPSMEKLKDVYLYAYKKGLKTSCYYLRTNAATANRKVTVSQDKVDNLVVEDNKDDQDCLVCSS
jgi:ribonucleoside-diphosphate reductase alpha chain